MAKTQTSRPCRSVRYTSEESANKALWAAKQNGRLSDKYTVSRCAVCHGWHIVRVV